MNKTTKKILFAVPIVIGVYLIVRQFTKGSGKTEPVIQGGETSGTSSSSGTTSTTPSVFPLKKGSRGEKVRELQKKLLEKDSRSLPKYGDDGIFGSETETALKTLFNKTQIKDQAELDSLTTWRPPMAAPITQSSGLWTNNPYSYYWLENK